MKSISAISNLRKPVVGVLIRETQVRNFLRQKPFEKIAVLETANNLAKTTLYFFSVQDVDLNKKKVGGVYFNKEKGRWEKKEFPYPDVLYKKNSASPSLRTKLFQFEKELKRKKVKNLNYPDGFNKWEVYEKLQNNEDFRQYIPLTILYKTEEDLKKMLNTCNKVYLKACRGGRGRQIIRVIALPKGGYEFSYYIDRLHVHRVKNFSNLVDMILLFYGNKKFVIQEAIDLITIGDSIIDMRAEVQKDGQGKITLAAIPVRVSNSNAPITTHAASYPFEYFFQTFMKYSKEEIKALKNRVIDFLISAYQSIEKFFGPSGEIGIDVGLDKQGRLWFIECNSRSMKVSLFNAYDNKTITKSFVNLLEYAKYIHQN